MKQHKRKVGRVREVFIFDGLQLDIHRDDFAISLKSTSNLKLRESWVEIPHEKMTTDLTRQKEEVRACSKTYYQPDNQEKKRNGVLWVKHYILIE